MKIAMLTSDYLPSIGGIASHVYQLSLHLERMGHEVEVWYWDRSGLKPALASMGDVPARILQGTTGGSGLLSTGPLTRAVMTELARFPADIVHIHTLDALLQTVPKLKKQTAAKFVWTNHTSRFLRKSESWIWRMKMRRLTAPLDGLLTASMDRMQASAYLPIPKRLNVPNGVDLAGFSGGSRSEARSRLGVEDDRFVMLYTGRFAPIKGVVYLADAVLKLRQRREDFTCIFCGDIEGDRESGKVRDMLVEGDAMDCCRFEGFVPNSDIADYLAACDVLVLPSLQEATSISCLEAMAASRAVIGTRIGGITELLEEGETGYLVEARDSDGLCQALALAMDNDALDEMGVKGNKRVEENYTWTHTSERVLEFYASV